MKIPTIARTQSEPLAAARRRVHEHHCIATAPIGTIARRSLVMRASGWRSSWLGIKLIEDEASRAA
ncbi:MAG: hypothetical protein ACREE9_17780 [Stellaceae bacterium]